MYERSAIVLERYMEKILELNKNYNLRKNNENYGQLISEIENYQVITEKVLKVIQEFEDTVRNIEDIQQEQAKLYKSNIKLEDDRTKLFQDLGEDANTLESKLLKIEDSFDKNNEKLKKVREEFIKYLSDFSQKQKVRNKCEKARRIGEANHIDCIKKIGAEFRGIDGKDVIKVRDFINSEKEQVKQEILNIMIKNGKNERVAFNEEVLKKAIDARVDIAEKEAECYSMVYDKMKKLLAETDNDFIKLNKYQKTLRDTSLKLAFLKAEKEYIVGFLDYERMTTISGARAHKKMMTEACNNFELDMVQIKNLYELILKEVANKVTKKAYKELYNKTYLTDIEDKEKNFEEEVNHVKISMGTVINSNYWRIEGIRTIYEVFQKEVAEKCGRDLTEFKIEGLEDTEENETEEIKKGKNYYEDRYKKIFEEAKKESKKYLEKQEKEEEHEDEQEYKNEDEYEEVDEEIEEEEVEDYEDEEYYEDEEDYEEIEYDEEEEEEYEEEQQKRSKKKEEDDFDDEDSIDIIIERSRKKAIKGKRYKDDDKGLFNKLFKK